MINITLPDGSVRQYEKGTTALQIAQSISEGLARNVLAAKYNREHRLQVPYSIPCRDARGRRCRQGISTNRICYRSTTVANRILLIIHQHAADGCHGQCGTRLARSRIPVDTKNSDIRVLPDKVWSGFPIRSTTKQRARVVPRFHKNGTTLVS